MRAKPTTSSSSPASRPAATHGGFTLLEVLLAILVIDVALLALVAGSATLVRRTTELKIRGAALRVANDRIQTLSIGPCAATTGSSLGPFDLRESWVVSFPSIDTREVSDSVTYAMHGRAGSIVLRTRVAC